MKLKDILTLNPPSAEEQKTNPVERSDIVSVFAYGAAVVGAVGLYYGYHRGKNRAGLPFVAA